MIIKNITGSCIKGRTFSYDLSQANAIVGDNFEGKSSITDAIRLALMGYLPEVGKRASSTWELSSGPRMEVQMEFDDSTEVRRAFWLEGDTIKTAVQCREPVGFFENLPLLNAEAYFGMTDSQRTAYVFERIKLPDSYTAAAIIAECQRISFEEAHSEQVEKAKANIVAMTAGHFPHCSMQDGLAIALESLREKFTYWNKREKETQGAVTTLAELKLRETTVVAAAAGVPEAIRAAQGELERLVGEKGQFQQKQAEAQRVAGRKKQIREILDADRIDYPRSIDKLANTITQEWGKVQDVRDPTVMREDLVETANTLAGLQSGMKKNQEVIDKATQRLSELSDMKCCPWCKSKGKGWQENLEKELHETIKPAEEANEEAERLAVGLKTLTEKLRNEIASNDTAIQSNASVNAIIKDCEARIAQLGKDQAREEARRTELSAELYGIAMLPEGDDLSAAIAQHDIAIRDMRQQISELEDKKDAETRLKQELMLAAQAELEHQDAAAHVLVIKAVAKLLKEKREAMINDAFNGLLEVANKLTEGIMKAPLALHENTVGMWSGGKFIPHRVFSGTEKALAYIAIAVALSSTAPLRLVLLDEFGRLDDRNQSRVIERLQTCVSDGTIDQFVVVGTSLPPTTPIGMTVIKVK